MDTGNIYKEIPYTEAKTVKFITTGNGEITVEIPDGYKVKINLESDYSENMELHKICKNEYINKNLDDDKNETACGIIDLKEEKAKRQGSDTCRVNGSNYDTKDNDDEKINVKYKECLHKMEQMKINIINKENQIHKLKLDKQYMEGGISMLKSNGIKLIPMSILTYIIIVSMAFCFFLICFILDMFTNVYIIHPFISFISAFISLGLLITAFAAIKHIKSFCLKILNQSNEVQDGNN